MRAVAIPPAWVDVWISPYENGHLQAVGTDAAGRRQYLYHPDWRARRDQEKFDSMLEFAAALPRLRSRVRRDLGRDDLGRDRVLGCAVRLLDLGFFRVGGETYAEENGSYGLATLEKRHVEVDGAKLRFDYPAKSGQRRVLSLADPAARRVVVALKRRRGGGPQLLAYQERPGARWCNVRSEEINGYIKDRAGIDASAKDFRTWHANVLAAVQLAADGGERSRRSRERAIAATVEYVAEQLGNTPAVCKASYIDPRVFDRYRAGTTIAVPPRASLAAVERAVLGLLRPSG